MSTEYNSWELTDFNIDGHINLSQKFGHLKMMRVKDGTLSLVGDANYKRVDPDTDNPTSFFNSDTTLGFIMDIGIRKEKQLTYSSGFYFGTPLVHPQSRRKVSQGDFDKDLFEEIGTLIEAHSQSGDPQKEIAAIKFQSLLNEYNNARLLYPNFYAESYLTLMRIIDALANADGAYDYATFAAQISPVLNQKIYDKLKVMAAYKERIDKAIAFFDSCLAHATKKGWPCHIAMSLFKDSEKFTFSCFYSAYQYRNKFVHQGFPFPDVIKDAQGLEEDSGMAYISGALGKHWLRFYRPKEGVKPGDTFDIHEVVGADAPNFQNIYFLLIPTWHFLKCLTREAILKKFSSL